MNNKWKDKFDNLVNEFLDDYQKLQVVSDKAHMIGKIVDIPLNSYKRAGGKYKIDDVKYSHSANGGVVWYLKSVSGDYDNITYAGATLPDEWFKQEKPKWNVGDKVLYKVDGIWVNHTIKAIHKYEAAGFEWGLESYDGKWRWAYGSDPDFREVTYCSSSVDFKFLVGQLVQAIYESELVVCQVISSAWCGHKQLYTLKVTGAGFTIQRYSDEIIKYNNQ